MLRQAFPSRFADLGFSIEMPVGFYEPEYPKAQPDFDSPTVSAPLLLLASPVALAMIVVAGRPAYSNGGVMEWTRFLADHFRITLTSILPGRVGGLTRRHPAIIADGTQIQDGTAFRMRLAVLEDGGRLITAHTMMPEEIAESSFDTLSHCILSFELADPKGPTTALVPEAGVPAMDVIEHDPEMPMPRDANEVWMRAMHKKLEAAVLKAQPFLSAQRYDEAEQVVKEVGADIYGAVAIGKMYTESLRSIVGPDKRGFDRRRAEELFIHALCWRQSAYPDPHTSYEAEQYEAGRTEDLNELVTILGSAPSRA